MTRRTSMAVIPAGHCKDEIGEAPASTANGVALLTDPVVAAHVIVWLGAAGITETGRVGLLC